MLVFIDVDLVCENFRILFFEEVMIILWLTAKKFPKNLILVFKLLFLEIDHFDLLDSKNNYVAFIFLVGSVTVGMCLC